MTAIPTKIGVALIVVFWLSMAGMVVNAYHHFNVRSINYEKI